MIGIGRDVDGSVKAADEVLVNGRAVEVRAADCVSVKGHRRRVERDPVDVTRVDTEAERQARGEQILIDPGAVEVGAADGVRVGARPVDVGCVNRQVGQARAPSPIADHGNKPGDELRVDARAVDLGPANRSVVTAVGPVDMPRVHGHGDRAVIEEAWVDARAVEIGAADRAGAAVRPIDVGLGPGGEDQGQDKQRQQNRERRRRRPRPLAGSPAHHRSPGCGLPSKCPSTQRSRQARHVGRWGRERALRGQWFLGKTRRKGIDERDVRFSSEAVLPGGGHAQPNEPETHEPETLRASFSRYRPRDRSGCTRIASGPRVPEEQLAVGSSSVDSTLQVEERAGVGDRAVEAAPA